tara:strand:- start:95 stop:484 length:390 start_codon:yes stop_codon:yes gene_type:complete
VNRQQLRSATSWVQEGDVSPNFTNPMTNWESLTVAQLKEECNIRGLKIGGKKADLVARLGNYSAQNDVLDAEMVDDFEPSGGEGIVERIKQLPVSVLAVIGIMLIGTMGGAVLYGDDLIEWIKVNQITN